MTPENKFGGSFGSNEWLVDEMYERYLADPNSVEANWQEFFSGYRPATNGAASPEAKAATPPIPKRQQVRETPAQEIINTATPIQEVVRANPAQFQRQQRQLKNLLHKLQPQLLQELNHLEESLLELLQAWKLR